MASEDPNSTVRAPVAGSTRLSLAQLHPKALDQPGGSSVACTRISSADWVRFGQSSTVDKLLEKVGVNVHKDLHGDRAAVAETAGLPCALGNSTTRLIAAQRRRARNPARQGGRGRRDGRSGRPATREDSMIATSLRAKRAMCNVQFSRTNAK